MATVSDDVRESNVSTIDSVFVELVRRFHANYPTFRIGDDLIRRYHLASSTRGFVILCGPSGTGKTWLAQAYAEVVGARIKLVAVDPELVLERGPPGLPLAARRLLPLTRRSASSWRTQRGNGTPRTAPEERRGSST